jgi:DNA repair exonuclease SbcCD ATPase subunit
MPTVTPAQSKIAELQAEIEELKQRAIRELKEKRVELEQELVEVDAEIRKLTGRSLSDPAPRRREGPAGRSVPLQELKELLAAAPDKTLNLRKAGLEARNVKVLAAANPGLLKIGGKGAWPTVTLLK